jgi:hypothetical protein
MVFFRRDLGYRFLNPLHLLSIACIITAIAVFIEPYHPEARTGDLIWFAWAALLVGSGLRNKRWGEIKRGNMTHTYYIGTSPFDFRWLPFFIRRNRKIARHFDPLFIMAIGAGLIAYSSALGCWLIFAGLCLSSLEASVHQKEINMQLDMIDGLISSDNQNETVEQLGAIPGGHRKQTRSGIPTGLASDVEQHLKRRKRK